MKFNPAQGHEFNITAELYHRFRERGHKPYVNYRNQDFSEFDLVLLKDDVIRAIFEIKANKKSYQGSGAQISRYLKYGLPIVLVVGANMIENAVEIGEKILRGDEVEPVTRLVHTI